jgi:hypothetical protein
MEAGASPKLQVRGLRQPGEVQPGGGEDGDKRDVDTRKEKPAGDAQPVGASQPGDDGVDLQPGQHLCGFYETAEECRDLLVSFLLPGLERGEKVICVAGPEVVGAVLASLRDAGADVVSCVERGQLSQRDGDAVYLKEGRFDPDGAIAALRSEEEKALSEGYKAIRIGAVMDWSLRAGVGAEQLIE